MIEKQIDFFFKKIKNLSILKKIKNKEELINLYNLIKNDITDEFRLFFMDTVINNKKDYINKELLDFFIKELNFNFGDLILYVFDTFENEFIYKNLDVFKEYISTLDKIQLNELLIESKKNNFDEEFNNFLVKCGADLDILNIKVKYSVQFYKKHTKLFREKTSRSCTRDRVLIEYLLDELGHPERKIKNLIHITGSNGKGSTCNFLKYILEENGYKVNVYTNPFVVTYRENYYICGEYIKDSDANDYLYFIKKAYDKVVLRDDYKKAVKEADKLDLFYGKDINSNNYDGILKWCFEIVMMILAFSNNKADFSIIEVRNGGLNDLTNVFSQSETIATILTFIQYGIGSNDGTMPLYDENNKPIYSNKATAYHKAKLGKKNIPIIVANQTNDVLEEIRRVARDEIGTYTVEYGREWFIKDENDDSFIFEGFNKKIKLNKSKTIFESFQTKNIAVALATLYKLQEQGKLVIDDNLIQNGINNTKVIGRPHRVLSGNYVEYFNNKNLEIITGFIKLNESGVDNIINSIKTNDKYNYIIYTSNATKIIKHDILFFEKLRYISNNNYKLIIYRKDFDVFEHIERCIEKNNISFIEKEYLSSALKYVKEDLKNKQNKQVRLFVLCDSMVSYDKNIEYLNGKI